MCVCVCVGGGGGGGVGVVLSLVKPGLGRSAVRSGLGFSFLNGNEVSC